MKLSFKKKETSSEENTEIISEEKKETVSDKKKTKRRFSKKQLRVISVILVIVMAFGCFFAYDKFFSKTGMSGKQITAVASVGNVSSVIEGSGTLQALQQYEITSLKKGEVIKDFFEEGNIVNEGDILYLMDDEEGREAIENAASSLNKAKRNYDEAIDNISNLAVKSEASGVVTQLYIEAGDSVNSKTKVADLIDNSNMILQIQFLSDYASSMIAGVSEASVTLSRDGSVLSGRVSKVSTGEIVNSFGAKVTNVEITVPNPGAIKDGDYATAEINGYSCSSEGTFKNSGKSAIYTEVSGEVKSVSIMVGDNVAYGQTVAILTNDDITDIDEAQETLSDAQSKYDDTLESLEDYVVKAPITGTIIQKNIKAGEKLESNSTSSAMAIIADLSSIVFEMSVDELDISKMQVGMEVEVKADAIENTTFTATITNISIVGTSNNGVTSYPVKITINSKDQQQGAAYANYDKLIPGLNVSATVVIERVENVIVVPVSAVRRGNIVIVSEDSKSTGVDFNRIQGNTPPQGFRGERSMGSDGNFMPSDGMRSPQKIGSDGSRPSDGFNGDRSNPDFEKSSNQNGSPNTSDDTSVKQNDRMQAMIDALDIPDGYKAIVVQTGLSDENFIEIKSGLSEGDIVLLPDATSSRSSNAMPNGMGGMPGGMGGMPGGMGGNRGGMGGMPGGMGGNSGGMGGGMR